MINSHIETQNKISAPTTSSLIVDKPFLNINETCQLLRVSRTTLWRLIKDDRLKVTKLGSRVIIARDNIYELFK